MGIGSKRGQFSVSLALVLALGLYQASPLRAATLPQLQAAVLDSGLVGSQFKVSRSHQNLLVESNQIYPNHDELKLALIQLASLIDGTDRKLSRVTLRAFLLNKSDPVEGSIAPGLAAGMQRNGDPDMLDRVLLKTLPGWRPPKLATVQPASSTDELTVIGDPIDPSINQKVAVHPKANPNLPVLGDPIVAGQKVVGRDDGSSEEPAFRTGLSVLRTGSPLPILLDQDIRVTSGQRVPVNAVVLRDIVNDEGELVIPGGSQVRGEVESTPSGARVVLKELYIGNRTVPLRAVTAIYPPRSQGGGNFGTNMIIGGVVGGVGGSLLGGSFGGSGGLLGGLAGSLLGSLLGRSLTAPAQSVVVIPAGAADAQLLDDVTVSK